MPLPASKDKIVLISGVNGYIASQTAKAFLDAGFSVRGTARSEASSLDLKKALSLYVNAGLFEIVEVKDIVAQGAFDEAVKGCYAIAHMASPVSQFFTDPEPVINTAVQGTRSMLSSAIGNGASSLKAVVLMSSIASVIERKDPPYTYTETDWNNTSERLVKELGTKTSGGDIYRASKAAGEKEFWKFKEEHKPSFTMTAINPAYVIGPPLVLPKNPEKINETVISIWTILSGKPIPPPLGPSGSFVDVRDVARLMVTAVEKNGEADGQRYIACGGNGCEQAIADILYQHYPDRRAVMARGEPGKGYLEGYGFAPGGIRIDASKARELMELEWTGYEQAVLDAAKKFERYL